MEGKNLLIRKRMHLLMWCILGLSFNFVLNIWRVYRLREVGIWGLKMSTGIWITIIIIWVIKNVCERILFKGKMGLFVFLIKSKKFGKMHCSIRVVIVWPRFVSKHSQGKFRNFFLLWCLITETLNPVATFTFQQSSRQRDPYL